MVKTMSQQIQSLVLKEIQEMMLDDCTKGIPGGIKPFPLGEIAKQGWNVLREDLPLPLMVLKRSVLQHNSKLMQRYLQKHNLFLAPHGKTYMAPQLFDLQIAGGAWAITAATVSQIQVYRRFGVQRILMANQLFGRQNVRYIVEEINQHPGFEFYCLVDSAEGVRYLAKTLREFNLRRPIRVLLEAGFLGGRTGFRTLEGARRVIQELRASREVLAVAGVEGFEGLIGLECSDDSIRKVDDLLLFVRSVLDELTPQDFSGVDEIVLTAGGSGYFERVAEIFQEVDFALPKRIVIRSGCYLTHDSGMYQKFQEQRVARGWNGGKFRPALEVWSYVQSLPEPGLAILTMGKRDCAYDYLLPHPEKTYRRGAGERELSGCRISALNDQHAYMTYAAGNDLEVGDMIACGISHPCTAFDKWRFIPVVEDNYEIVDAIITFF
jgi:D-serine dehydratase